MFPLKDYLPHQRVPLVTIVIVALNVLVWLLGFGHYSNPQGSEQVSKHQVWVYEWGTIPCELFARCENQPAQVVVERDPRLFPGLASRGQTEPVPIDAQPPWLTMLASAFLHGSFLHLAFNMLFLWVFGGNVEDSMSRFAYIGFYLSGAVIAALAQALVQPSSGIPQVGASGAIAAVIGGYLLLYPRTRVLTLILIGIIPIWLRLRAWFVAGAWGVMQFVATWQTLFVPGAGDNGIAYMAHLAGFMFGLLAIRHVARSNAIYEALYRRGQPPPGYIRPL